MYGIKSHNFYEFGCFIHFYIAVEKNNASASFRFSAIGIPTFIFDRPFMFKLVEGREHSNKILKAAVTSFLKHTQ